MARKNARWAQSTVLGTLAMLGAYWIGCAADSDQEERLRTTDATIINLQSLRALGYTVRDPEVDRMAPSRLRIVNDAAYDDMYFKHFGVNPTIDTEEDHLSTN